MIKCDVAIIGGGPAGMAAALASSQNSSKTLLIERESRLGGILNQCIHNGFGLHYFKEELTGPEYATRFVELIKKSKVNVMTDTFVTKIEDTKLEIVGTKGAEIVQAKSIVLAMGARERTAGAISLNGTRPAGVFTAGQVQKMVNLQGKLPCKNPVILGSGDIGLVMARRLTLEGAKVQMVLEIMKKSGGLARNICQCIDDFNIPLKLSTTVLEVVGENHIEGVYIAEVDDKLNPILSTKKFIKCDALILSVGLIPENDILPNLLLNPKTKGAVVNEYRETNLKGVFSCGNVLHIHDLVDNVSEEATLAGKNASLYAQGKLIENKQHSIIIGKGISYTVPTTFFTNDNILRIMFRVTGKFLNSNIIVTNANNEEISKKFVMCANSGEMQYIDVNKSKTNSDLTISIQEVTK